MNNLKEIDKQIELIKEKTEQLVNDPQVGEVNQKVLKTFEKTSRLFKEYFNNTEMLKQEPDEFNYEFMKKFIKFFKNLEYLPEEVLTTVLGNFTQSIYDGLDKRISEQNITVKKSYQKINSTAHLLTDLVNHFEDYKREMNQKYDDLNTKFNEVLDLTSTVMEVNKELQQGLNQVLAKPLQCIPGNLVKKLAQGLNRMSSSIKKIAPSNKVKYDSVYKNQRLLNNFCIKLELSPKTKYILRSFPDKKDDLKVLIEEFEAGEAVTHNELTNPALMYSIINEKFGFKLKPLADLKKEIMSYLTSADGLTFGDVYNKFKSFDKKIVKKVIYLLKEENKISTKQGSNYIMVV